MGVQGTGVRLVPTFYVGMSARTLCVYLTTRRRGASGKSIPRGAWNEGETGVQGTGVAVTMMGGGGSVGAGGGKSAGTGVAVG